MSAMTHCVDASLVVRLATATDESPVVALWEAWDSEDCQISAPGLLYYEVTNALYRYQRQGWYRPETVELMLAAVLALPVDLVNDAFLHQRARVLATSLDLRAAYDAHYLALAEHLNCDLWTADAHLVKVVGDSGPCALKLVSNG